MVSKEIVMKYLSVFQDITYKVRGCQESHNTFAELGKVL